MKKDNLELRIFVCFVLTILYVQYSLLVNNNNIPEVECEPKQNPVSALRGLRGFEVRIINDYSNERLELTETLGEALSYIEEYREHHDDLVAFDISTGAKVGSSQDGNGVIYSETLTNVR
tara:strand:- start:49 stop:408 length:360 start_codon:yes stop_codon:yes gene_type:complete